METQRKNAIRIRLDTMASKMREVTPAGAKPNAGSGAGDTTDKGLISSALHTQGTPKVKGKAETEVQKTPGARIEVATLQDAQDVAARRKASLEERKLDKCPVCGRIHTYERTWSNVTPPVKAQLLSTHLTTCPQFSALSPEERLAAVLGNAACLVCAGWDHTTHRFPGGKTAREPKCAVLLGGVACGGQHGKWYHDAARTGNTNSVVATASTQSPGLYEVYSVPVHPSPDCPSNNSSRGMVMVDPGSDTNFVRNEFARQLGLTGEACRFRLKVVDREARAIETLTYVLDLEDKFGNRHQIRALGLDAITTLPADPDLEPVRALVQEYPEEVLKRPQGEVDVLLGLRDSALHGATRLQWGNLRLLESPLGCGWSLRGSHPALQYPEPRLRPSLSATAYMLQQAQQEDGKSCRSTTSLVRGNSTSWKNWERPPLQFVYAVRGAATARFGGVACLQTNRRSS